MADFAASQRSVHKESMVAHRTRLAALREAHYCPGPVAFRAHIRVRFGDEDHAQIVYYPRFFDFFHQAFEDFFTDQGHPYREVLDVDRAGWPAVHAEADHKHPLRFGDVLELDLWLERIGTSAATFSYRGRRQADNVDIVTGRVTVACVHLDTFKSQPIPDKYRALFERHATPPTPLS